MVRRKMLACRKRLGLTQKEVADAAHIQRHYYTMIENGQSMPSIYVLKDIAEALKTNWKDIVDLQKIKEETTSEKSGGTDGPESN